MLLEPQRAGERDHGPVVGAEFERRVEHLMPSRRSAPSAPHGAAGSRPRRPPPRAASSPSREARRGTSRPALPRSPPEFPREVGACAFDRAPRARTIVSTAVLSPLKLKFEIAAREHRARQPEAPRAALLGQPRERGPAGVAQAEQLRGLVERLAGGVVDASRRAACSRRHRATRMSWVWPPETSSATNGNAGARIGQQRRKQMAFEVVDADHRHAAAHTPRPCATLAPTSSAPASPGPAV